MSFTGTIVVILVVLSMVSVSFKVAHLETFRIVSPARPGVPGDAKPRSGSGSIEAMEWVLFWVVAGVVVAVSSGVLWGRKYFRHEIERARRIRRSNGSGR